VSDNYDEQNNQGDQNITWGNDNEGQQDVSWNAPNTSEEAQDAPQEAVKVKSSTGSNTLSNGVRKARSGEGAANVLSWSDVGSIFEFTGKFEQLESNTASLFCELFDIDADSHVIDVAQTLYPSGGEIAAFGIVTDIVDMVTQGSVGFADGIKLVTRIDALPDLTTKTVARQISSITDIEIKHRKNSRTTDFVASILDALDKTRESGKLDKLAEFHELLEVWPGNKK
jgi:hypothetical protein